MPDALIYLLADCPKCRRRYAALPDPYFSTQYIVHDRVSLEQSHVVLGGLLCLCGTELTAPRPAVRLTSGAWLAIGERTARWLCVGLEAAN